MNKYPAWLNVLVLVVLVAGIMLALPNIYGSVPSLQLAPTSGDPVTDNELNQYVSTVKDAGITPEAAYIAHGRAVLRFNSKPDQFNAGEKLTSRFQRTASVALTLAPKLPPWVRNLDLNPMSLGLDLRGGIYVLLQVDMDSAIESRMESYRQDFDDRLRDAKLRHRVDVTKGEITVRLTSAEDMAKAQDAIELADPNVVVTDGEDGKSLRVRMSDKQVRDRQDFAIEQNITTLRNRVDQLGVAEPLVQRQGLDRIVVQLPGVQDPNRLNDILTATATLEFRLVDQSGEAAGSRRYPGRGSEPSAVLKREVIASGDQIVDARSGYDRNGQVAVSITLDSSAGQRMLETTQDNIGKPMSTLFIESRRDSTSAGAKPKVTKTEEIINTATIRGVFKNKFQITGLSQNEANNLALLLRAGALAAPVYKVDERTIGPTLGQENIDRGFRAIVIGFFAVVFFMAFYYRWFGVIANVALFSNLILIVALLSLLQASLTLPGIAGIVLTVGMAVDANVLIFERIREELKAGASPQAAINAGYEKALSSIADANITTLIAGVVLFALGTGPIKGFAITLSLGIITSMFTAIIGTRVIVNLVYGGRRIESVPI